MNGRPLLTVSRWLRASCAMLAGCAVIGSVAGCGAASAIASSGSRSPTEAFAEKILRELKMPPGTSAAPTSQVPSTVGDPWAGETGAVDQARAFTVPLPPTAVETYVMSHGPAGAIASGWGTEQGPHGVVSESVYFHIGSLPPGVSDADVQLYLVPRNSGATLVAAYAHVARTQSRTAAERLAATSFEAVKIRVDGSVTYSLATESVIANLVTTINALSAAGVSGASSCPGSATDYLLTFEPRTTGDEPVTVESYSCDYDIVTAEGVPQPALSDPSNAVAALAARLTHTSQYKG
jgi:hypothetical protein